MNVPHPGKEPTRRAPRAGRVLVCSPAVRLSGGPVLLAELLPLLLEQLAQRRQRAADPANKPPGR